MSEEIRENTEKLLKSLNYFIAHIILYFITNISIVTYAFYDLSGRWWIFLIAGFWALGLIYHSILVYGVDLLNTKNKKVKLLLAQVLKLTIG